MKKNLKIFNIVMNMGDEIKDLLSYSKDINEEKFNEAKKELETNVESYNIIADKYMEDSAKVSMEEIWDKFQIMLVNLQRYLTERTLLHLQKKVYIAEDEELKINHILDDLEFLTTKDED